MIRAVVLLAAAMLAAPASGAIAYWPSTNTALVRDSAGRVVTLSLPVDAPSVGGAGGSASVQATQRLAVGGAATNVTIGRTLSASQLAAVGRVAARAAGPLGIAMLALEGVKWANDRWEVDGDPLDPAPGRYWVRTASFGAWGCNDFQQQCSFAQAAETAWTATVEGSSQFYAQHTITKPWELESGNPSVPGSSLVYRQEYRMMPKTGPQVPVTSFYRVSGSPQQFQGPNPGDPATDAQLEDAIRNALIAAGPLVTAAVLDAIKSRVPLDDSNAGPLSVTGPDTLPGQTTTTTTQTPSGTQTTTTTITNNITYQNSTINITTTTTTTDGDTTTTTTTENPAPQDQGPQDPAITCGLPDTPPCKIDETGTPEAQATVEDALTQWDTALGQRQEQLEEHTQVESLGWLPELPSLSVSCSPVQVGNLFAVDVCPALDISRAGFGFLWGALGLIYCWRRVGETVAGGV